MVPMDTEKNELNSRNVEVEGQTYVVHVHVLVIKISHHVTFLVRWATTSFKSRWLPSLRLQVFKDLAGAANIYLLATRYTLDGRRELRERPIQPPKQRSFEVEIPSRVHQASFSFVIFLLHSRALAFLHHFLTGEK